MLDIRFIIAINLGKVIAWVNKNIGKTGATAAPGLLALKIDPNLIAKTTKDLKYGSIVISGTNGKTTTARLISHILAKKYQIIHNRQGSNLERGIASTIISRISSLGKLQANIAIWEVDEATFPNVVKVVNPRIIVLLNLFRDQLDRYGEVDSLRQKWQQVLQKINPRTTLILNSDDPGISILEKHFKGQILYFGVEEKKLNLPKIEQVADVRHCLICNSNLKYSSVLSAHLGHYYCPKCHFQRPKPQVNASKIQFMKNFKTQAQFSIFPFGSTLAQGEHFQFSIEYSLPGLYNLYNILASFTVANYLNVGSQTLKDSLQDFSAAFGRFQNLKIGSKKITIFLTKNPAGANEVLRTISLNDNLNILAILNDNFADGRDVSWIWDVNWEILAQKIKNLYISGTRAWDLAARTKYAGIVLSKNNIYKDISYSIEKTLEKLNNNDTLLILPTYTALLIVQKILYREGAIEKWQEQ